jgi:hypothetical protein
MHLRELIEFQKNKLNNTLAAHLMFRSPILVGCRLHPDADDQANPTPLLGPTCDETFFHVVFAYNNALTHCGMASNPYDTDGNGIIFDSKGFRPIQQTIAVRCWPLSMLPTTRVVVACACVCFIERDRHE